MPEHPKENLEIPADVSEADALDQARPVTADDEEEELPSRIDVDEPEADALDQARTAAPEEDPDRSL